MRSMSHCPIVVKLQKKEKLGISQDTRRENSPSQSEIVGENVESKGLDIENSPNTIVHIVVKHVCLLAMFYPFHDANGDG